jgi:hypothetical protein
MWALLVAAGLGMGPADRFSVDGSVTQPTVAIATIQPRLGAPGYSWLRIYFYASPLGPADRVAVANGRAASIKTSWSAVLQLTVDPGSHVSQIDLSLPGHTCTIAETDGQAKSALPQFQLDGRRLRLAGEGSHVCDMTSLHVPNETFGWKVDLETTVVDAAR